MNFVILIVVYRRYVEFLHNLPQIRLLSQEELGRVPIIIVRSDPNKGHNWMFKDIPIDIIIDRPIEDGEVGQSISYHCSRDMKFGLDFIKTHFNNPKIIAHCCDVCPQKGTYHDIKCSFSANKDAFLVALPNTVVNKNIWHTNFFAVGCNEDYWPPLSSKGDPDILEHKWGKQLRNRGLQNFDFVSNTNFKTFSHVHEMDDFKRYLEK